LGDGKNYPTEGGRLHPPRKRKEEKRFIQGGEEETGWDDTTWDGVIIWEGGRGS